MKKNDYSRLYALLKNHPMADKDDLVYQYTNGRTTHVSQMTREEFTAMCDMLQYGSESEQRARNLVLKRARSAALLRIGRLGISTIDNWAGINDFVSSPKIAGKKFYDLKVDELNALVSKLESIIRKGGLKALQQPPKEEVRERQVNPQEIAWMMTYTKSNNSKHLN